MCIVQRQQDVTAGRHCHGLSLVCPATQKPWTVMSYLLRKSFILTLFTY